MACAKSWLSSAKAPARAQRDKPSAMTTYCQVAVALPVHEPFTYTVPPALLGVLSMGHAVLVPFGPRKITGYVLAAGPSVPPIYTNLIIMSIYIYIYIYIHIYIYIYVFIYIYVHV